MRVRNEIDRYHLVIDVINHLKNKTSKSIYLIEKMENQLIKHNSYIQDYGEDMEEIREWKWENK